MAAHIDDENDLWECMLIVNKISLRHNVDVFPLSHPKLFQDRAKPLTYLE